MGLGDNVRNFIKRRVNNPIDDLSKDSKKLVAKIRSGKGGSDTISEVNKVLDRITNLDNTQVTIDNFKNQLSSLLRTAKSGLSGAEMLREANVIGSALNPAAAAISLIQEKLMDKFKGEIKDLGSVSDILAPTVDDLKVSTKQIKDRLQKAVKDKEESDKVNEQKNKQLGIK